ncbi:hypothetical protein KKB64_00855 [Patescibacteria group bacterium]|nr:hypothetical protein [Patescibacteria group bacterium]MBU1472323.1 hypothetical protein [Patescibacteria group bacterium]MBU2460425.1 hypothetical protein [Patescibacteria group bacterium]MBU2544244.1 hypothetical protein [Patescibacteria group bacterium]
MTISTSPEHPFYEISAECLEDVVIGTRPLTTFEDGDMLLTGLEREDVALMTPGELAELADLVANQSTLLLGC